MVVDLLLFPVICMIEGICKLFHSLWRGGLFFMKCAALVGFVPIWDAAMLTLTLALWILCKIFRQRTPKVKWGRYLMCHPTWQY